MQTAFDDRPEVEYLDGRPFPKVSPKTRHGAVQLALGAIMRERARSHGLVSTETRFRLSGPGIQRTSFIPDISYVARERLDALSPADRQEPPFAPDIAVEILSASDDLRFLKEKIARYLAAGSILVLDVDSSACEILAHSARGVAHFTPGEQFVHAATPWLHFPVAEIFSDLGEYGL